VSDEDATRRFLVGLLAERGLECPAQYVAMLDGSQAGRTIDGLWPWAFDADPREAIGFCSEAVGREILPFAQAIGEDLMACFDPIKGPELPVVVIDPWNSDKPNVVRATLQNFAAWLSHAELISKSALAAEKEREEAPE